MMGWPQITMLVLLALSLGVCLAKHGEPRNSNYSFWISLFSASLQVWLLWEGGFFS